jgi:AraC-like DNA-binding protein
VVHVPSAEAEAHRQLTREHQRFFSAPLRFQAARTTLCSQRRFSTWPAARPDPSLLSLLDRYAADQFLLGFSELSAFHRALRRWAEQTPVAFRAAARVHRRHPSEPA